MEKVVIMGAAGRDFHDFNTVFRGDPDFEVVAFTHVSGQNLGEVDGERRRYPTELAGEGYPEGVPIAPESELDDLLREEDVDVVVFSYSDVRHEDVMHAASRALAAGAEFRLLGPRTATLPTSKPVVAVDAVRTGCGKSQTSRKLSRLLRERGLEVVVVREPMPYGDISNQEVQRFGSMEDVEAADVTIEEREEYEGHVRQGVPVYAGVDYEKVLERAEAEADVVVWDGGNNELPFLEPTVQFVLADPLRAGDEIRYHPGETNLRTADYVVVNKENSATQEEIDEVVGNVEECNPDAEIVHADSVVEADGDGIRGRRVLVVEDGPTLTHGGTSHGAGRVAAEKYEAAEILDPRGAAVGSIADALDRYPWIDRALPALGYSDRQIRELEESIANVDCEVVVSGTPIDIAGVVDVDVPVVQVSYEIEEKGVGFGEILDRELDLG